MFSGHRRVMSAGALAPALLVGSFTSPVVADDDQSVLGQSGGSLVLVLDGSGSMAESAGGGDSRMEAARSGLTEVIGRLPEDSRAGLLVYGSQISDGPGSCEDTELLAPVETLDKSALQRGVDRLEPLGNTPIAYSLEKAFEELPSEGPRSIVLVSDGEENCGGDPCEVARDLREAGADFYVDVVGLQVDGAARDQLTCIANAGGGTYYDVSDLDDLTSTLTRTSVRAARGYEPAGLPVEGGTDVSDAAPITDGQWLDTVGDSGTEHYELPDPTDGTLHLSAAQSRTGTFFQAETLSLQVLDADGTPCGEPSRDGANGNDDGLAPATAALALTPEAREGCGAGPYVLAVTSEEVRGVASLEIVVRTERAVENLDALPSASEGDDVQADVDTAAEPVSVLGGTNFSSAPPTAPGRYADTILASEVLFYRVPDVGWGRQVVCDLEVLPADDAADFFGFSGGTTPISISTYGPMKTATRVGGTEQVARYGGAEPATAHATSPPATYRNREATGPESAASLDGSYYCQVNSLEASDSTVAENAGEIPFVLTVDVVGEVSGEPEYAADPAEDAGDDAETSGVGVVTWLAAAIGLLVVLVVAWWLVRRRRRADASVGDTHP